MIVDKELLKKIENNSEAYKKNSPQQTHELLEKWKEGLIDDIEAVDRFNGLESYKRDKTIMLARVNYLIDIME